MPTKIEWTDEIERFWEYVYISEALECWEWTAGCFSNGYGQFRSGEKKVRSHRYSYEIFFGKIPKDMCVLHKCDNPKCVNPLHLFLGTHKDNSIDRDIKQRGAYNNLKSQYGEKNGASKLKPSDINRIRELRDEKGLSYRKLSFLFKISPSQVGNICRGEAWNDQDRVV